MRSDESQQLRLWRVTRDSRVSFECGAAQPELLFTAVTVVCTAL